ncbi:MAG: hypothetical protein ABIT01_15445, partial [Thermoanaerobaculia bacterium]
ASALPGSPTVVAPGEEARFLAPLPLEKLSPELDVAATLSRWGIRSIGEFARLSAAEVTARLGELGHRLHALARGADPLPLMPRALPPTFREGMELEWPLVTLEPLLSLSAGALERLMKRLEAQALGCVRLEIALTLEPDGHDLREIALPAPTRDVKTLLKLIQLNLEAKLPGAAVAGFAFTAHPDRPRSGQLTLFGPTEISPDKLATALARLMALLGEDRLGQPQTVNGHRPERFALAPYAPPPPPTTRRAAPQGRGLLSVRVLRPPVELEVLTEEPVHVPKESSASSASSNSTIDIDPRSRLVSVRNLGSAHAAPDGNASPITRGREPRPAGPLQIEGSVRVASGPWELEEAWWSDAPVSREYWDVELAGGGIYRLFRERGSGEWFADGIYD